MANTLATISNGKLVSQRALSLLVEQFPFLTSAYSDFSDASARKGDIVTTHLITAATAVAYSTANGYVAGDRTQTDCIVSLDNLIHSTVAINDSEAASSSINLIERFAASAAHALGKSMVDTLLGTISAASYTSTMTVAADVLSYRSIVSMGVVLDGNKVPSGNRYAIVSPNNKASLLNDSSIVANAQIQGDTVRTGSVGIVNGIEVFSYPSLPSAISKGFAAQQEALLVAARLPEVPSDYPGLIENVTEPVSGLSLQMREFYNPTLGTRNRSYVLLFGCGRGSTASLVRLV